MRHHAGRQWLRFGVVGEQPGAARRLRSGFCCVIEWSSHPAERQRWRDRAGCGSWLTNLRHDHAPAASRMWRRSRTASTSSPVASKQKKMVLRGALESGNFEQRMMQARQPARPQEGDDAAKRRREHADFERDQQKNLPGIERPSAAVQRIVDYGAVPLQRERKAATIRPPASIAYLIREGRDVQRFGEAIDRIRRERIERDDGRLLDPAKRGAAARSGSANSAINVRSCRALLDGRVRACRTSTPPAPGEQTSGTGSANRPSGAIRNDQSQNVKWKVRHRLGM